jgi:hypothetical protein
LVGIFYKTGERENGIQAINNLIESSLKRYSCLQGGEAMSNPKWSSIDLVATILQFELLDLVTKISIEVDAISEERTLTETALSAQLVVGQWESGHWQSHWGGGIRIEATVRKLSAALASEQWSKGHAPLAEKVLQEYCISLNRLRSQGEYVSEGVQQISALTSIEETRRGMQQADSIRR